MADKTTGKIISPLNVKLWSPNSEYWITSKSNPYGNGTLANPFDGSTQIKFDAIMHDLLFTNAAKTIHLGPGTFLTYGAPAGVPVQWVLTDNTRIIGAGKDITFVKNRDGCGAGSWVIVGGGDNAVIAGKPSYVTNCEISSLTADCNGANAGVYGDGYTATAGIGITGYKITVRDCKVIHCKGIGDHESMGFVVANYFYWTGSAYAVLPLTDLDCLIENCDFTDSIGNYVNGFGIAGGTIRSCRVYFPIITNNVSPYFGVSDVGAHMFAGYNCASLNARVVNNYQYGGTVGFYSDSWSCTNSVVTGNIFEEVSSAGIRIAHNNVGGATPYNNTILKNNIIKLSRYGGNTGSGNSTFGIDILNGTLASQALIISGNIIYGGEPSRRDVAIRLTYISGAQIIDNIWDDEPHADGDGGLQLYCGVNNSSGITWQGNRNFSGRLVNITDFNSPFPSYLQQENAVQVITNTVDGIHLQYYQAGFIICNSGASGSVNCYLWPAYGANVGNSYTLDVETAQRFSLTPYGSDTIRYGTSVSSTGGANGQIYSSTVGNVVRVTCIVPGQWTVDKIIGTWNLQ